MQITAAHALFLLAFFFPAENQETYLLRRIPDHEFGGCDLSDSTNRTINNGIVSLKRANWPCCRILSLLLYYLLLLLRNIYLLNLRRMAGFLSFRISSVWRKWLLSWSRHFLRRQRVGLGNDFDALIRVDELRSWT